MNPPITPYQVFKIADYFLGRFAADVLVDRPVVVERIRVDVAASDNGPAASALNPSRTFDRSLTQDR